jgi:hypothetical protein
VPAGLHHGFRHGDVEEVGQGGEAVPFGILSQAIDPAHEIIRPSPASSLSSGCDLYDVPHRHIPDRVLARRSRSAAVFVAATPIRAGLPWGPGLEQTDLALASLHLPQP